MEQTPPLISPYKGLAPYDVTDEDNFFGREREKQILTGKIFSYNITLLFAATGTGKSSLLRAAVMPGLTEMQQLDVVYYADWVREPVEGLQTAIRETLIANGKITGRELKGNKDLHDFLKICTAYSSEPLVLMLDQFEELFQYHRSGSLLGFVEQFVPVINDKDLPLSLVFSMREDFLAELNIFKGKIPGLFDNFYRLERLRVTQARAAIEKPVERIGFHYEEGLVDQLLHDLTQREQQDKAGAQPLKPSDTQQEYFVEPPYLQIVCQKLWQAEQDNPEQIMTLARYEALGRTEQIVQEHVESVMNQLTLSEQALAFQMFQYLVTSRGTKMAYRDEDLADTLSVPVEQVRPILEYLASRDVRILRLDNRPDGQWYELYHDVFAEIITGWTDRFREDEDRHLYGQIVAAARKWEQERRDDNALLRGERLVQAEEWNKKNRENLSSQEKAFVDLSSKKCRQARFVRRTVVTVITLLGVLSLFFGLWAYQKKKEADRLSRGAIAQFLAVQAVHQMELGQDERGALLARQAYLFNQENQGNALGQADNALRTLLNTQHFSRIFNLHETVISVVVSPDRKYLAAGDRKGIIRLWKMAEPYVAPVILNAHKRGVWSVAFSPDSTLLASSGWDKVVRVWNLRTPDAEPLELTGHKGIIFSVQFSPDGRIIASGSSDHSIRLWDLQHPKDALQVLRGHQNSVNSVAFSPNGQMLASGSSDLTVRLWNLQELQREPLVLHGHEADVNCVAFSPDGRTIASAGSDNTLRVWNSQHAATPPRILPHKTPVFSAAFSHDGQFLASGSQDGTMRVWNVNTPDAEPMMLTGHDDLVLSLAFSFSSDGRFLVSGSQDWTLRVWEHTLPQALQTNLRGHTQSIRSLAFSPAGDTLASTGKDNTIRLWKLHQPGVPSVILHDDIEGSAVIFSPDGERLIIGDDEGNLYVWRLNHPDASPVILQEHEGKIRTLVFSPNGRLLASGSDDKSVRLWHIDSPHSIPVILQGHEGPVFSIAFSSDGDILLSGSQVSDETRSVHLWDLQKPDKSLGRLWRPVGTIASLALNPDRTLLALSPKDRLIRFWDPHITKQPLFRAYNMRVSITMKWKVASSASPELLYGHRGTVTSLLFSPNRRFAASGSTDKTVRLWELSTGAKATSTIVLHGHESGVTALAFSPDEKILVSGSEDGTIFIWSPTEKLAEEVCRKVWRNLSPDEWEEFVGESIPYEQTCPDLSIATH